MPVSVKTATQFSVLTIALTIGLTAVIGAAFRVNVGANWDEQRCDAYVIPIAGFFKPSNDPRSAAQFATDNWSFCQKQFIQEALRVAAEAPQALADAEAATVGVIQEISSTVADVFYDLWKFCYETYATFMDKMKGVAKLFHNFMINLYSITERLNASALAIIYGLISLIVSIVNSIQVTLIVAIIVIGIILVLQILLFFILMPISGLIVTVTALVSVVVVSVATAIAAATVSELFSPGACFDKETPVQLKDGKIKNIETIVVGDVLRDGGRVTATHTFRSSDTMYSLNGIHVTGDHLIADQDDHTRLIHVSEHPDAIEIKSKPWFGRDLICLTTTSRRIPCYGTHGVLLFADWEEIPESDTVVLREWHNRVWQTLNHRKPTHRAPDDVIESESGLSPNCVVVCADWLGRRVNKPISEVRVGDRVYDSPTTTTTVVGKVRIAGNQATDAVEIAGGLVSCATWVLQQGLWNPAKGRIRDAHPIFWEQLYTKSGSFMIDGDILIRDASDVGLGNLRSLVETVVLANRI